MRKLLIAMILAGSLGVYGWTQDGASPQPQSQPQPETSQPPTTTQSPADAPQANPPQTNQSQANPTPRAAQSEAASNGASNGPSRIAAGSVIPVQLTKTIDAKKVKTGEEVDAKVTQDMKSQSGQVLVPKDTKIVGHVTEAQPRSKEQKESQLGITFDRAVMKEGGDMVMPASIQAVIVPQNQSADNAAPAGGSSAPAPSGGSMSGAPNSGRSGNAGSTPQASSAPAAAASDGSSAPATNTANNPRPQITASTQGVIGQADYKLSTPGDSSQGSVVTSEKGNVKLEGGTMLLLRVSQ
jgi:hypothetical protein